jgi:hypothetical protein
MEIDGSMTTSLLVRLARTNGSALAVKPGVCPASPGRELGTVDSSRGLDLLDTKKCGADTGVEGPDPAA